MKKEEIISAFAFNTGKQIEELINEQTNNLQAQNELLQAKILQWYVKSGDQEFAKHFDIINVESGTLDQTPMLTLPKELMIQNAVRKEFDYGGTLPNWAVTIIEKHLKSTQP